jgi:hypothetical protein
MNKYTWQAVPFFVEDSGEIRIMSSDPDDNDETCIVTCTKIYYYHSHYIKDKEETDDKS